MTILDSMFDGARKTKNRVFGMVREGRRQRNIDKSVKVLQTRGININRTVTNKRKQTLGNLKSIIRLSDNLLVKLRMHKSEINNVSNITNYIKSLTNKIQSVVKRYEKPKKTMNNINIRKPTSNSLQNQRITESTARNSATPSARNNINIRKPTNYRNSATPSARNNNAQKIR